MRFTTCAIVLAQVILAFISDSELCGWDLDLPSSLEVGKPDRWLGTDSIRKSEAPRGIFAEPCDLSGIALAKTEARNAIPPCGKPQGFLAKKGEYPTSASIVLWVSGLVGAGVTSWLPSEKAELIGQIMFSAACPGELG